MHVPRATGHEWHLCTKVVHAPRGHMQRRRKMKLCGVIGTKGGHSLFMLAAVPELDGATSRRFCDFRGPPPGRFLLEYGTSYEHQIWWVGGHDGALQHARARGRHRQAFLFKTHNIQNHNIQNHIASDLALRQVLGI